jgi:hypothetical protein
MGSRTFLVSVLYGVASGLAVHHVPRVVVDGTVLLLFLTSASFFIGYYCLLLFLVGSKYYCYTQHTYIRTVRA